MLFGQDKSLFALDLISVREVLCLTEQPITPVPNTLPFLLGLTNLRGEILPIADLGRFIGLEPVECHQAQSRILVVEAPDPRDVKLPLIRFGLAVSQVQGVISVNPDQIVSAADTSEEIAPFLRGLYDQEGRLLMILDVEALALARDRW